MTTETRTEPTTATYPVRDRVSTLLFELHCAAMDASADPTQESIGEVQKAFRKMTRELPSLYSERWTNR